VISAAAVRELLQSEHRVDEALSRRLRTPVYVFADGSALLMLVSRNGRGRLYASYSDFLAMNEEAERQMKEGPKHLLEGRLQHGQHFLERVPGLVGSLPQILRLDPTLLDGTESSLDAVDEATRRIGAKRALTAAVFEPLVAYIGEVMRRTSGGHWEMRLASDGRTWEPWIVDAQGRSHPPFMVFDEFYEHGARGSVRGFVAGQLRAHRLGEAQGQE
jgi:hypothetical protein